MNLMGWEEPMKSIRVKDVMTSDVETIHAEDLLKEAAQKMAARDVGALPVWENDHIMGILTDRDITVNATAEGKDPNSTKGRDIMHHRDVVACFADQDL